MVRVRVETFGTSVLKNYHWTSVCSILLHRLVSYRRDDDELHAHDCSCSKRVHRRLSKKSCAFHLMSRYFTIFLLSVETYLVHKVSIVRQRLEDWPSDLETTQHLQAAAGKVSSGRKRPKHKKPVVIMTSLTSHDHMRMGGWMNGWIDGAFMWPQLPSGTLCFLFRSDNCFCWEIIYCYYEIWQLWYVWENSSIHLTLWALFHEIALFN